MRAVRTLRIARGDITRWTADAIATSSNPGLVGNARPEFWRHRVPRRRQDVMAATMAGYPRTQSNRDGTGVPYMNVDGQIHAAAGPELRQALLAEALPRYRKLTWEDRTKPWRGALVPAKTGPSAGGLVACLAGEAVHTRSFGSLTRYTSTVIHAVAPDGRGSLQRDQQSQALLHETYTSTLAAAHDAGASSLAIPSLGCGVNNWDPALAAAAAMRTAARWLFSEPPVFERLERLDFVLKSEPALEAFRTAARTHFGEPVSCTAEGSPNPCMDTWQWNTSAARTHSPTHTAHLGQSVHAAVVRTGDPPQSTLREHEPPRPQPPYQRVPSGGGGDSSDDGGGVSGGGGGGDSSGGGGGGSRGEGHMDPSLAARVLNNSSDAIVHVCPRGRVVTWNLGASEIFRLPASKALGRELIELVIPPHIHHIRPLDVKPQYDRRHLRRAPARRHDGSTFTAEFTVQPLDEHHEGGGTVIVLRDASEMGETVRKLRVKVAELEAAMQRLVSMSRPTA